MRRATSEINPLVSICMPTYNGSEYIQEALDSILHQTYKNIEIIISDDASTDTTVAIIKEFKDKVSFPVDLYHHDPMGIAANWNNTMEKANGKYIKFLFQDDVLLPTCIEKMISLIESNSEIALVTSKRDFIVEEHNKFTDVWIRSFKDLQVNLKLPESDWNVLRGRDILRSCDFSKNPINSIGEPTAILFKKKLVDKIGYFNPTMFQLVDYEYWLRMLKHYDIGFIKEKLVKFRLHGKQASYINNMNNANDKETYFKLLYTDYFWLLHIRFKWKLLKRFHFLFKWYRNIKVTFGLNTSGK